jgi:hypothetical protein
MDKPPSTTHFDEHFTPIATELGRLVFAWNELHENLGQMYEEVLQPKHFGAALASWRAIENDRSQRLLLQYAVAAIRWEKTDKRPSTKEDIDWILEKTNKIAEDRNNAIHSPYAVFTSEDDKTEIRPLDFFGNPRALKLAAKYNDLVSEINFYFRRTQALSGYAHRITFSLRSEHAWPERPVLPER